MSRKVIVVDPDDNCHAGAVLAGVVVLGLIIAHPLIAAGIGAAVGAGIAIAAND